LESPGRCGTFFFLINIFLYSRYSQATGWLGILADGINTHEDLYTDYSSTLHPLERDALQDAETLCGILSVVDLKKNTRAWRHQENLKTRVKDLFFKSIYPAGVNSQTQERAIKFFRQSIYRM
jgi:hypothetical protein